MKFEDIVIETMAYELPPEPWSSSMIEDRLKPLYERLRLPFGRLELMTGIKERRFWPQPMAPSEASAQAGKKALEASAVDADEIDLLIHCAVCRDCLEPATAAFVHKQLGLASGMQVFDVSNACLGFLNALTMAATMIQAGQIRAALLVAGEDGRPLLERTLKLLLESDFDRNGIKPYFANLTIGAGAVATVLCHRNRVPEQRPTLLGGVVETDSSHSSLCHGDVAAEHQGLEMQTDSEELLKAGLQVAKSTWEKFKKHLGWDESSADRVICHQVGSAHRRQLYHCLGIDLALDFSTFERLGNVGSVSLPITLAMAAERGKIAPGDQVALLGIGSGVSCLMLGLRW